MSHRKYHRIAMAAVFFGALAVPGVGSAAPQAEQAEFTPMSGDGDGDGKKCDESLIELEYDVTAGAWYIWEGSSWETLGNNTLIIGFDSQSVVTVNISYTQHEWYVDVTPDAGRTTTYTTIGGMLRFNPSTSVTQYVISSEQVVTGAMNMIPTLPDIIIEPMPNCPPPP